MRVRLETRIWAGFVLALFTAVVMSIGPIRDSSGAQRVQDQVVIGGSLALVLIMLAVAIVVHRELRHRQATERELRASESRLRSIIDNTSAVIFVKDLSGKYLLVNRAYAELMGMESGEMVGKTAFDLFPQATAEVLRGRLAGELNSHPFAGAG